MTDLPDGILEDDYMITDCGPLYSRSAVSQSGKCLKVCCCMAEAIEYVRKHADTEAFWPSAWHVNDHGNVAHVDYHNYEGEGK